MQVHKRKETNDGRSLYQEDNKNIWESLISCKFKQYFGSKASPDNILKNTT